MDYFNENQSLILLALLAAFLNDNYIEDKDFCLKIKNLIDENKTEELIELIKNKLNKEVEECMK